MNACSRVSLAPCGGAAFAHQEKSQQAAARWLCKTGCRRQPSHRPSDDGVPEWPNGRLRRRV